MELDAQRQAELREQKEAERKRQELAQLRTSAGTAARGSASDYFTQQGLDPGQYGNAIQNTINQILAGISPDDPNPGSYFNNIGERIYGAEETGFRTRSGRSLDPIFGANFELGRIPYSLDDPYLAGIEGEQRSEADAIIQNMLSRGVITPTGQQAALADLERQEPTVRARLNEIGTGTLSGGQQSLRDIANRARQTASTLTLGSQFDPFAFSGEADTAFNDFINTLGDTLRSKVPGNLFNTAGLGAIAGAAQGPQNTPFDPNALRGLLNEEDEETPLKAGIF